MRCLMIFSVLLFVNCDFISPYSPSFPTTSFSSSIDFSASSISATIPSLQGTATIFQSSPTFSSTAFSSSSIPSSFPANSFPTTSLPASSLPATSSFSATSFPVSSFPVTTLPAPSTFPSNSFSSSSFTNSFNSFDSFPSSLPSALPSSLPLFSSSTSLPSSSPNLISTFIPPSIPLPNSLPSVLPKRRSKTPPLSTNAVAPTPTLSTTAKSPLSSSSVSASANNLEVELDNPSDLPLEDGPTEIQALFDQSSFRSWNLQLTSTDIEEMNRYPDKEVSYPCSVTSAYGSEHARTFVSPTFGCRYRGSVGSLRMCVDENHRLNGQCRKLSIVVETTAFKPPKKRKRHVDKIHGAKNLIFGGCPADLSLMSERLSYNLLNALNITAPLASHAKLFMNGKYLGVYSFVQSVDDVFTELHFKDDKRKGKGGLYKQVWFNEVHMANSLDRKEGANDDDFMKEIMANIEVTSLVGDSPMQFVSKYFDTEAFVDVTAFNSVIGNTDDWRMRHNFYWYIRETDEGKRAVLIPWDYDRLYDRQALTRGALAGRPWFDIEASATPAACNIPIQSPAALAAGAGTPQEVAQWTAIFKELPSDFQRPVTCDKITQIFAVALGARVRARTREYLNIIPTSGMRSWFNLWNAQIDSAISRDPDGPSPSLMREEQEKLINHLEQARALALKQAIEADSKPTRVSPFFIVRAAQASRDPTPSSDPQVHPFSPQSAQDDEVESHAFFSSRVSQARLVTLSPNAQVTDEDVEDPSESIKEDSKEFTDEDMEDEVPAKAPAPRAADSAGSAAAGTNSSQNDSESLPPPTLQVSQDMKAPTPASEVREKKAPTAALGDLKASI